MKTGKCPECPSTEVYFTEVALEPIAVNGKRVPSIHAICTECGFFETYNTDQEVLKGIVQRAQKPGDWKPAGRRNRFRLGFCRQIGSPFVVLHPMRESLAKNDNLL